MNDVISHAYPVNLNVDAANQIKRLVIVRPNDSKNMMQKTGN